MDIYDIFIHLLHYIVHSMQRVIGKMKLRIAGTVSNVISSTIT